MHQATQKKIEELKQNKFVNLGVLFNKKQIKKLSDACDDYCDPSSTSHPNIDDAPYLHSVFKELVN